MNLEVIRGKLADLKGLKEDPSRYDEPPTDLSIKSAERMISLAQTLGLVPKIIRASVDGGITVYFENSSTKVAYIDCANNGNYIACISDRKHSVEAWEVPAIDISLLLNRITNFLTP